MTTFGGGNAGSLLASGSGCRDRPSQCTVACVLPVLVGQRGGGISAGGGDAKLSAVRYLYGKASVDQTCVVEVDWPTLYRSRLRAFKICQQYDNQAYEVVMLLV